MGAPVQKQPDFRLRQGPRPSVDRAVAHSNIASHALPGIGPAPCPPPHHHPHHCPHGLGKVPRGPISWVHVGQGNPPCHSQLDNFNEKCFPSLVPITVISPFTAVKLQVPPGFSPADRAPNHLHCPHHHGRSFCCHNHYSGYFHESRMVCSQTFHWESFICHMWGNGPFPWGLEL